MLTQNQKQQRIGKEEAVAIIVVKKTDYHSDYSHIEYWCGLMIQASMSFSNSPLISPTKPEREIANDDEQTIEKGLSFDSIELNGNNSMLLSCQHAVRLPVYHTNSKDIHVPGSSGSNESNANQAKNSIAYDTSIVAKTDSRLSKLHSSNRIVFKQPNMGNLGRLGEPSSIFNMLKKCQKSRFDDSHFNQIYLNHHIHSSYVCCNRFIFLVICAGIIKLIILLS